MRLIVFAIAAAFAAAFAAAPAAAEILSADATGFELRHVVMVPIPPAETYDAIVAVGQYWSSEHTYSGDAANMTIDARAGGCFCETLPDSGGSVEHGRVVMAWPGRTLRLTGGLGPLQASAANAVLTWSLEAVEGGTRVTMRYAVSGRIEGGGEAIAPLVDRVLAEQVERLRAHLAR